MPISVKFDSSFQVTHVCMSGLVTRADYRKAMPYLEAIADDTGPLKLLLEVRNFDGWAPVELKGEALSSLGDLRQIDKIAIVAPPAWKSVFIKMSETVCDVEVESFRFAEMSAAKAWIRESVAVGG